MTTSLVHVASVFRDLYPRAGERIKQWVVDERKLYEREQATCPRIFLAAHSDNTGALCRNVGPTLWIDADRHDCCCACDEVAAFAAAHPDVAAWLIDRATWPTSCADRSVLSDEIAPDIHLTAHPTLKAFAAAPRSEGE